MARLRSRYVIQSHSLREFLVWHTQLLSQSQQEIKTRAEDDAIIKFFLQLIVRERVFSGAGAGAGGCGGNFPVALEAVKLMVLR